MDETQLELARDRIGRLFQFLDGFNALRNPVIRHIDQAGFKLWLDSLPDHPVVERGWLDPNADFVLSVGRPSLTDCPAPPHELNDWLLDGWTALDRQIEVRTSRPLATRPSPNAVEETNDGDAAEPLERFEDDATRVQAFERWQAQRDAWIVRERPAREAMAVFGLLYTLYGELERENGQLELVAGDAILDWYTTAGRNLHPLILQTMQIALEPEVPRLVVAVSDRAPELNTTLLRAIDEIDSRVLPQLLEEFEAGEYEPFSGQSMDGFLGGLAVRLHQQGRFSGPGAPTAQRDAPAIGRRPLFFTRKRNAGFSAAIEAILADIAERMEFPNSLLSIAGIEASASPAPSDAIGLSRRPANEDPEILFTKPANEEQAQIARRLERYQSVMVQGPPGTGKTHTIANLIGHLLAQGKRVLVTSHTAKALERVREVIVDDLQALAVSVVSNDLEGRSQLEQSVTEITRRLSSDNSEQLRVQAARLAEERAVILSDLDQSRRALEDSVSSEYRPVVIDGAELSPSAAAREVNAGRGLHDWIPGPVEHGALPLTIQEVLELYRTNTAITLEDERDLAGTLPAPTELWTPSDFTNLVSTETDLRDSDRVFGEKAWTRQPDLESLQQFERLISAAEASASVFSSATDWELEVLDAGRRGGGYREMWDHLVDEISRVETIAEKAAPLLGRRGPVLPDVIPSDHLVAVLERMLQHLASGGTFSRMTLLVNREWSRVLDACRVAQGSTRDAEALQSLLLLAELTIARDALAGLWSRVVTSIGGMAPDELGKMPEIGAAQIAPRLRRLLSWSEDTWSPLVADLQELGLSVALILEGLPPQLGAQGEVLRLRQAAEDSVPRALAAKYAAMRLEEITREFESAERALAVLDGANVASEPVRRLRLAIATRDVDAQRQSYERLVDLHGRTQAARTRVAHLSHLDRVAPAWASAIRTRSEQHGADQPPGDPAQAWRWCQLDGELTRRTAVSPDQIQARIEQLERDLARCTGALVSARAWAAQLERTTQAQRSALMGWMLTMRKVGRGTGKRAPRLLSEARVLMGESRSAVPVWILPLSRVVETFDFRKTQFDVVIIDEASQSDLLAMTALYLGRQVVIVGDHEQVSPDAVGQRLDDTQRLIDQFLGPIPNRQLYDGRASIYDFGQSSFTGLVQLREHFRSVPDIIQFSNDLSYNGAIRPLREAGDVALRPHVVAHRVEGVRAGSINQAEADFIVSAILAACQLEEYRDATFGVISLLGDEQARLIDRMLRERLTPAEFERRRILAGSPPQFQGDERDVMFLSVVDSPGIGPLTLRQDDSLKKRYNVAASRARDQMWIVHSLSVEQDLKAGDLRERLIRYAMDPHSLQATIASTTAAAESPFETAVASSLLRGGYRVELQHEVGAYRIDMVVSGEGRRRIAIECDGERWHTRDNLSDDLARQAQLERMSWRFIRIRGSEYYRDPEATMDRVRARLTELEILPSRGDEPGPAETSDLLERVLVDAAALRESFYETTSLLGPRTPDAPARADTDSPPEADLATPQDTAVPVPQDRSEVRLAEWPEPSAAPPIISPRQDSLFGAATTVLPDPPTANSASDEPRLMPYQEWRPTGAVHDPREAPTSYLIDMLVEVAAVEGPVLALRAYRLVNRAAGGQRLAKASRAGLNRAAAQAIRTGVLIHSNPLAAPGQIGSILRLPNTDPIVVRTRGSRELEEIPPDEIGTLLRQILRDGTASPVEAKRLLLELYGWKRLTSDIDRHLDLCLQLGRPD